jgi:hypothetical protein
MTGSVRGGELTNEVITDEVIITGSVRGGVAEASQGDEAGWSHVKN